MQKQIITCMVSILFVVIMNRVLPHNLLSAAARILLGSACIIQAILLMKKIIRHDKEEV